ncbi:riboflavin kinase [Oerskovia sp. M15]
MLPAAISIGTNPTFDGVERRVEAYVLDRTDLDLYDEEVVLEFVEHLRPTVRFDGIDALVETMHDDVARARVILAPGAGTPAGTSAEPDDVSVSATGTGSSHGRQATRARDPCPARRVRRGACVRPST